MNTIDAPIFLVGSVRSGTTLLRLMLDHHPEIAFNLESEFLVSQVSDDGNFPDINRFRFWLAADRVFRHSKFSIDDRLDYVGLVNDFLRQKMTRDRKRISGATVHEHFRKLPFLWPKARYIYIYRDGRDVAHSAMRMGWAGNVYFSADLWIDAENEWAQLREKLTGGDWIEVRYEDLVSQSEAELKRICAFLQVPYSERMFDYSKTSTYGLPDRRLAYQWKKTLDRRDVERLESKLGERLLARGYALSDYPRITLSAFDRFWLHLDSRFRNFRFRMKRFGIVLTLQEKLFRMLGLGHLHERTREKIDAITDSYLK